MKTGFKERIKKAKSLEEAKEIYKEAQVQLFDNPKAYARCKRAFESLSFKEAVPEVKKQPKEKQRGKKHAKARKQA